MLKQYRTDAGPCMEEDCESPKRISLDRGGRGEEN